MCVLVLQVRIKKQTVATRYAVYVYVCAPVCIHRFMEEYVSKILVLSHALMCVGLNRTSVTFSATSFIKSEFT
jgi:hypothetical protein